MIQDRMKIDNLLARDTDQVNHKIKKDIEIKVIVKSHIKILVDKNCYLKMEIEKNCLIKY